MVEKDQILACGGKKKILVVKQSKKLESGGLWSAFLRLRTDFPSPGPSFLYLQNGFWTR